MIHAGPLAAVFLLLLAPGDEGAALAPAEEIIPAPAFHAPATPSAPDTVDAPDVPAEAPPPGTLFLHAERFEREDGSLGTVERGVLYVPAVRGSADDGVLAVEFWRFPAAGGVPDDRPPVFYLPGGPGFPGLAPDLERRGFYEREVAPFRGVADIVVMGQRGIGASKPNTACRGPEAPPAGERPDPADRAAAWREAARACRAYWEPRVDLQAFTVLEAADDVDAVRRALGYGEITLWGVSFGSHWAMAVMRRHPEAVERALLAGTEGPNHTYDDPAGVLEVFRRIGADAADARALEGLVPEGGFVAALRRTVRAREEEPRRVTVAREEAGDSVTVTMDGDAVRRLSHGYLGSVGERRWEASWPLGVSLLARGERRRAARWLAPPAEAREGGGLWRSAAYFMLDCSSGITPERERRLVSDPAREVVGEQNRFYRATCPVWDADLGDAFRTEFETAIPTVVVHGSWDLATPLENALELLPRFRDHTFVRVERGSHGALDEALGESGTFRRAVAAFLATGDRSGLPDRLELPEPDWVGPEALEARDDFPGGGG